MKKSIPVLITSLAILFFCLAGLAAAQKKIYWTEYGSNIIGRANLDGSGPEDLITSGLNGAEGIALDLSGPPDLVINEVMAYPSGSANEEWVEVYVNEGGDVGGYDLHDQDTHTITFPSFTPAAGEYIIVVTGSGVDQLATSPYVIYRGHSGGYWNDDGDDVVLRDPSDNCIDYMAYDELGPIDPPPAGCSWSSSTRANPQAPQGTSISLISDGADTDQASDWATSGDSDTVGPDSQGASNEGSTAVELTRFEAVAGSASILIEWETASEIDSEGFHLWRADARSGEYVRVSEALIPAQGSPVEGASYEWTDPGVESGETYLYKLEDIDIYGTSAFHGPVEATAGGGLCFFKALMK